MRKPTAATLLAAVGPALLLAACTRADTAPPPSPTERIVTPTTSTPPADLRAALLTTADLPRGFAVAEDPDTGAPSEGCPPLDADVEAGASAHAEVLFAKGDLGPYLRERLLRFSLSDAQSRVTRIASAVDTCRRFISHDATVGDIEFSVTRLNVEPIGDATAAIQLAGRLPAIGIGIYQDLVVVRQGTLVIVVSQISPGSIDTELTRSTVQKAYRKAQGRA